jgi:hypothetical protein
MKMQIIIIRALLLTCIDRMYVYIVYREKDMYKQMIIKNRHAENNT